MTVESLLERIFRGKFKIEWMTKRAMKIDQFFFRLTFRLTFFHLLKPETALVYIENLKRALDEYAEELKIVK